MRHYRKLNMKLFLITAAIGFLLCGCVPASEHLANPVSMDTPGSDVVIGAAFPLTGKFAHAGREMMLGAITSIDILNAGRGIAGRRVKLEICDTRSNPAGAEEAMKKLAAANVSAVIGGYSTSESETLSFMAEKLRIPLIITCATADSFCSQGRFVYRITCSDTQHAEGLASYLFYWRQIKNMAILTDSTDQYGCNISRSTAQYFADAGGTILKTSEYNSKKECESAIRNILAYHPQAIMLSAGGKEAAELITALRKTGFNGVICGADNWDGPEFFKALGKNNDPGECCYVTFASSEYKSDEAELFSEIFRIKHYHYPESRSRMAADAVTLMANCLANAPNIRKLNRNWMALQGFFGVTSIYNPRPDGSTDRMIFINRVAPPGTAGEFAAPQMIRHFLHSKLDNYKFD